MFKFRLFLTAFLLITALFSACSEAAPVKHGLNTANSTLISAAFSAAPFSLDATSLDTTSLDATSLGNVSLGISHPSILVKVLHAKQQTKPNKTAFDALQPRLTASNSSLFLFSAQTEPEYDVIYEFFIHTLARQFYLQPKAISTALPWYTVVSNSKKSRISGWKEANLLYSATNTHHA
ncbi:hypothetical protein [Pseudoalteromonas sp. JB197]|uniref:hypothetical protein n=1 Tax=Pseudoalteromonas sp. JB197 TaxID=1434839 RepID=UPI00097EF24A|nr:hypothetical protein [Pseudoalteromonas sp. JB197]PCC12778.1 hypothetical protein CIK86_05525 [Pseudoalteromonas sp. JB197]SJN39341.1 conserved protein of unknown function [Pseudoalteromonas sp. JB197]